MRFINCVALVIALFSAEVGVCQADNRPQHAKGKITFATNECFRKGGIGVINKNLDILLNSDRNELAYGKESKNKRWSGLASSKPEIVTYFDGRVYPVQLLPSRFDLSKSVIVSFERDKVRFFDFVKMSGCYYERLGKD